MRGREIELTSEFFFFTRRERVWKNKKREGFRN